MTIAAPLAPSSQSIDVVVAGNRIRIIESGADRLAELLALIEGAQVSLKLFFYMVHGDTSGMVVRDALVRAARRGVAVTMLLDGFGSSVGEAFFAPLIEAGGRFGCFGYKRSTRYLIRNHQKMVIADDHRFLGGGFNIADDYFSDTDPGGWEDLAFWMEGPDVAPAVRWYHALDHWVFSQQRFLSLRRLVRRWHPALGPVRWLIGGPVQRLSSWARHVKHDLEHGAQLDMVEAYFSPPPGLLRRIGRVAKRGRARVITPALSDNSATVAAARLLYGGMLRRGVEIYEYRPRKLHMKLIVIDDIVYIGSANFDMRSLFLNLELMLRIEDASFAAQMRALVDARVVQSEAITPALHKRRAGIINRLIWWLSYMLVGVMDYTITRRLNFAPRPRH